MPTLLTTLFTLLAAADATIERQVAAMGTTLAVVVDAPTREAALQASECAVRAVEATEQRLSTWREDSELSRLNRTRVGETVELSPATARDLGVARDWAGATHGAFEPALGALVAAWDLRGAGRVPAAEDLRASIVAGGIVEALALDGQRAVRRVANLRIEEGGFGKGAGLDAALAALPATTTRATFDFGGQVAVFGRGAPFVVRIADPRERARAVVSWSIDNGSLSTSGDSEHASSVDGARIGHILDARTGHPAPNFGSVSVWCASATAADCLSTALFVMGPQEALDWAEQRDDMDALVLSVDGESLRARATSRLRGRLVPLVADLELSFVATPSATPAPGAPVPDRSRTPSSNP